VLNQATEYIELWHFTIKLESFHAENKQLLYLLWAIPKL